MAGTSAYRTDAELYRRRAAEPPEDGLDQEQWRSLCHAFAKAYDALADRHEQAYRDGRGEEFWRAAWPEPHV